MGLNITVIDDGVMAALQDLGEAADGTGPLPTFVIKLLLEKSEQSFLADSEAELFKLFKELTGSIDNEGGAFWNNITGFTHPEFYLKAFEHELYRSDLIIFDWTYRSRPLTHIDTLVEILKTSHAYLYVFTGDDNIEEVREVLSDQRLIPFSKRVDVFKKGDGTDALIQKAKELQETNFSFKFGSLIRKVANKSLDGILNKLADLNIERVLKILTKPDAPQLDLDIKQMLGERIKSNLREGSELKEFLLSNQPELKEETFEELLELIAERLKGDIAGEDLLHETLATQVRDEEIDMATIKDLWAYRLYHKPSDKDTYVRKGDILVTINADSSKDWTKLFFVLTPDCDLAHFWKKNLGYLQIVPMYLCSNINPDFKADQLLTRKAGFTNNLNINSLSSSIDGLGGNLLLLPFIKTDESVYTEYVLFPKEIHSIKLSMPISLLELPSPGQRDKPLQYEQVNRYARVCCLNEPFLTPTVQHILSVLGGYGVPDYPNEAKGLLVTTLKTALA